MRDNAEAAEAIFGQVLDAARALGVTEIEAIVVPRVEDFREHPRTEMKESVASALQTLEQSLDNLLSSRINALENQLLELSASLADLSHRASQSHMNLQKLVNAVERLCDQRAPEPALPAASEPVPALERSLTCLSNSDRCFQFAGRQTIVSGLTEPVTTALEPWEDRYLRTIRYRFSSRLKSRLYAGPSASCG